MSAAAPLQTLAAAKPKSLSTSAHAGLLLQRKCACGSPTASLTGKCAECKSKNRLQTKLTIGASNDPLEQEADRVADQVLAAPANPAVSGAPPHIQRFTGQPSASAGMAPASVDRVLASPGRPLDLALQQDMEQRFGHDFSRVRVHTDVRAAESARAVNALAYTVGRDVVFGANEYAPATHRGRGLLAHELAHTIQQRSTTGAPPSMDPNGIFESSADAAGRDIANGQVVSRDLPACGVGLARSKASAAYLDDKVFEEELKRLTANLKKGEDPGPWYQELKAEADRRATAEADRCAKAQQPVAVAPPEPPATDPDAERAAAVAEAEAVIASMEKTMQDDDDEGDVAPVHKAVPQRPTTLSLIEPDPRAFTDEQIYKETKEAIERIDESIAEDRELSKIPYKRRLNRARRACGYFEKDFRKLTGEQVWRNGLQNGHFLESEKEAVYEDQNSMQELAREKQEEAHKWERHKRDVARHRQLVDRGEQHSAPQMIIQPVLVAAAAPALVAAAYAGTQAGLLGVQTYNACVHGTKADCAAAMAHVGAAVALHRVTKGEPVPKRQPIGNTGSEPRAPSRSTEPVVAVRKWTDTAEKMGSDPKTSESPRRVAEPVKGKVEGATEPAAAAPEPPVKVNQVNPPAPASQTPKTNILPRRPGLINRTLQRLYLALGMTLDDVVPVHRNVAGGRIGKAQPAAIVEKVPAGARTPAPAPTPASTARADAPAPTTTATANAPKPAPTTTAAAEAPKPAPTPTAVPEAPKPVPTADAFTNVSPAPPTTAAAQTDADVTQPSAESVVVPQTAATAETPAPASADPGQVQVYVNLETNVFHLSGSYLYRRGVRNGAFMTRAAAEARGAREAGAPRAAPPSGVYSVQRRDDGVEIRAWIGERAARAGAERELPSAAQYALDAIADWERAHSTGAGLRVESAAAIRLASRLVNQTLQNRGIEDFLRQLRDNLGADRRLHLQTVTATHPRTLRLESIHYVIGYMEGERLMTAFEVVIEMRLDGSARAGLRLSGDKYVFGPWFRQ